MFFHFCSYQPNVSSLEGCNVPEFLCTHAWMYTLIEVRLREQDDRDIHGKTINQLTSSVSVNMTPVLKLTIMSDRKSRSTSILTESHSGSS